MGDGEWPLTAFIDRFFHRQASCCAMYCERKEYPMEISRREFMQITAGAAVASAYAGPSSEDLAKLTISEASRKIRSGEISCVELAEACTARAKAYNPKINA